MAEYIEKDVAQKKIASIATLAKSDAQKALMGRALYCIDHIPPADVAPVVRCGECRKHGTPGCAMWYQCSVCGGQWSWETNDGFCSYGERRGT